MRTFLAASLSLAISGYAVSQPVNNYRPVRQAIDSPKTGEIVEVAIGKEMVRHGNVTVSRGIRLSGPVPIGGFTLSPGFYPTMGEDEAFSYHGYRTVRSSGDDGVIAPVRNGLGRWATAPDAVRSANDGSEICLIFADEGRKSCRKGTAQREVVRYRLSSHDLQQKLIFDGGGKDRVRLIYREESGHFARPPLAQQIEFAGPLPRVIEYKGARIRVESADGDTIRFELIENFPSYWTGKRELTSAPAN